MPRPTKAEFVELLRACTPLQIVNEQLLAGIPYAFEADPSDFVLMQDTLATQLGVGQQDISVVGSGRTGFSLDPNRFGNPYTPGSSDIDAVVVSAALFDTAWHELCSRGRSVLGLDWRVKNAVHTHRTNNIFYGFMEPNRLKGAIALSPIWFRTFRGLGRLPTLAPFDIQGRLYRTWEHVKYHQVYSLLGIKAQLKIQ